MAVLLLYVGMMGLGYRDNRVTINTVIVLVSCMHAPTRFLE